MGGSTYGKRQEGQILEELEILVLSDGIELGNEKHILRRGKVGIRQITKHLNKLVDVVKLVDLTEGAHIERELMLIKVKALGAQRAEIARTVDIFRGQIIDLTTSAFTIQITGAGEKLDAFIAALGEIVVLEVARTGVSGIARGDKTLAL